MNGKLHPAQSAEEATEATEVTLPEVAPTTAGHAAAAGPPGHFTEHVFTAPQPRPADATQRLTNKLKTSK